MKQIRLTAPRKAINAIVTLPSSKSICNRALIMHALSGSTSSIKNLSDCDDTRVMLQALRDMPEVIDIQAAGTAMRFLTAFLSVTPGRHTLTGTERMKQRPIRILVDALRLLGANIEYMAEEGFPPLRIEGKALCQQKVSLPGSVSSQYISALLLIGPMLPNGLHLTLTGNIISRPYINLTLQLMKDFGADASWISANELSVGAQPYQSIPFTVESDWSAASYWYEIVALSDQARVVLPALYVNSFQGDAKVAELFAALGVSTRYVDMANEGSGNKGNANEKAAANEKTTADTTPTTSGAVVLERIPRTIQRMEYDFLNQPDLAQTFVVTCALLNIPFRFSGLQSLKIKETDRMAALINELRKLGYVITETDESILTWNGERCEADSHPVIDTYEDHRMAMAFAPAILRIKELWINNPQVVSKSYPHYWENLVDIGFEITES